MRTLTLRRTFPTFSRMSFPELLEAVDHLDDAERAELARRLRARELAADPARLADLSARLDRMLAGQGIVTEDEVRAKLRARGLA